MGHMLLNTLAPLIEEFRIFFGSLWKDYLSSLVGEAAPFHITPYLSFMPKHPITKRFQQPNSGGQTKLKVCKADGRGCTTPYCMQAFPCKVLHGRSTGTGVDV